jgi:hypothetical protein
MPAAISSRSTSWFAIQAIATPRDTRQTLSANDALQAATQLSPFCFDAFCSGIMIFAFHLSTETAAIKGGRGNLDRRRGGRNACMAYTALAPIAECTDTFPQTHLIKYSISM